MAKKRYVYVLTGPKGVKVGQSNAPSKRLYEENGKTKRRFDVYIEAAFECGFYALSTEAMVHDLLSEHHVSGDWFSCTPEVAIEAIKEVLASMNQPIVPADVMALISPSQRIRERRRKGEFEELPKRRGAKPGPKGVRDAQVVILVSPPEKRDLTRACDGRSVSSMVRQILTAWTKRELARQRRERSTKGNPDAD